MLNFAAYLCDIARVAVKCSGFFICKKMPQKDVCKRKPLYKAFAFANIKKHTIASKLN